MAETCDACLVAWSHRLILVALPFILACCATVAVSVADLAGSEVGLLVGPTSSKSALELTPLELSPLDLGVRRESHNWLLRDDLRTSRDDSDRSARVDWLKRRRSL